jgi:putative endonuclease
MYTVYILVIREWKTYVGYTDNLPRRIEEHNSGKSGKNWWAYGRWPWTILQTEEYELKNEAMKKEKWYKSWVWRKSITSMKTAGVSA